MYYAVRCEDGSVLRLSRTLGAVRYALVTVSPVLWMVVLVLIFSGTLAFRAASTILEPVNSIDLDKPDASKTYPELAPLVGRIEEQNLTIREREDAHLLSKEAFLNVRTDFQTILDQVNGIKEAADAESNHLVSAKADELIASLSKTLWMLRQQAA